MTDMKELRRLAELCTVGDPWYEEKSFNGNPVVQIDIDAKFIAMCNPPAILSLLDKIDAQEALIAELRKDAERLDKLNSIGITYGFEDMHEGNTWTIGGAYRTVRHAIDSFKIVDTSTQEVG